MQNGGPNPSRRPPQWPFLDRKGQNYCTWAMMGLDLQSCRCVLVPSIGAPAAAGSRRADRRRTPAALPALTLWLPPSSAGRPSRRTHACVRHVLAPPGPAGTCGCLRLRSILVLGISVPGFVAGVQKLGCPVLFLAAHARSIESGQGKQPWRSGSSSVTCFVFSNLVF
jgi:hypothetical protein